MSIEIENAISFSFLKIYQLSKRDDVVSMGRRQSAMSSKTFEKRAEEATAAAEKALAESMEDVNNRGGSFSSSNDQSGSSINRNTSLKRLSHRVSTKGSTKLYF